MNREVFAKVFPLGSHLCREPMPAMSELKRDMENSRRHGFNLVKLQEHWAIDEPLEGQYDFSRYEELIEHAARLAVGQAPWVPYGAARRPSRGLRGAADSPGRRQARPPLR